MQRVRDQRLQYPVRIGALLLAARTQPGRHDRRQATGASVTSRPSPPAGHTALDRHASPNTPPAPYTRPSAPCCSFTKSHTLMTALPNPSLLAPNQRAPVVLSFRSHGLPPYSGDENDTCRTRHEPWPTLERPLPRQKTHDARRLAGNGTRSPTGSPLRRVSVTVGAIMTAGSRLQQLGTRADTRTAGIHLCSFGRRARTRSASADLHCHAAGAGPAVNGGPTGPSEASREAAPVTAEERRLREQNYLGHY